MNNVLRSMRTVLSPSLKDCGRLFLDLTMVMGYKGHVLVPQGNILTLEKLFFRTICIQGHFLVNIRI